MRVRITLALLLSVFACHAQSYNSNKVALTNFLVRMYNSAPFDGVKIVEDYDSTYLVSVIALDKSKYNENEGAMNRVADVKALAQASRYFNGSNITQEMVIRTTEKKDSLAITEITESLRETSLGHVRALEQLTSFTRKDGKQVYIYIKRLGADKPAL